MINTGGQLEILIIRRLRCMMEQCRRIHHELPDCLYPYKRHCAETIEQVIGGEESNTCCGISESRGIMKWWKGMHPYFMRVLLSLNTKHGTCFSHTTPPREIVRAVANSNSWVHTRSVVTPAERVATIIPKPIPSPFPGTQPGQRPTKKEATV